MGTVSARIPDDLEAVLDWYLEEEQVDRSTAVRRLLSSGLSAWRMDRAIDQLESGDITVLRAAEIAGVSVWELAREAEDRDATWVGRSGLEEDLEAL